MASPLINSATEWNTLKQELVAAFGGGDDDALCGTLEGLSDFRDLVAATMRSARQDDAMAEALRAQIGEMQERKTRLENRAEGKRKLVELAMIRAEDRKITLPDMTLSIAARPPFVIVTDKDQVPAEFWTTPAPEIRKSAIASVLKSGQQVPGAVLSNGGWGLNVRVK